MHGLFNIGKQNITRQLLPLLDCRVGKINEVEVCFEASFDVDAKFPDAVKTERSNGDVIASDDDVVTDDSVFDNANGDVHCINGKAE